MKLQKSSPVGSFSTFCSKIMELGILNEIREMEHIKAMTVTIPRKFVTDKKT